MRNRLELPVYKLVKRNGDIYDYVRMSDIKDEYTRLEFERFMFGQTMPLIQLEHEFLTDAVFFWDYERFQDYLEGKQVLLD